MTTEPTPLVTVLPCPNHPATVIHQQSGKSCPMFCQAYAPALTPTDAQAIRLAALEEMQAEIIAAYKQGALDVHNHWQDDRDPDFTEAAHDYASSRTAIRALSNKTGEGSNA